MTDWPAPGATSRAARLQGETSATPRGRDVTRGRWKELEAAYWMVLSIYPWFIMVPHPKKNASELRCFEFASESDRSNINLLGGFKDFKMIKTTNQ